MIGRERDVATGHIAVDHLDSPAPSMVRGVVVVADHPRFIVDLQRGSASEIVSAELLSTSNAPLSLMPGDSVLCWVGTNDRDAAVIMGRIGQSVVDDIEEPVREPNDDADSSSKVPESLVIEAKHSLTLRVGDGSITIREDGKILIKGKDLVSHAQRMNRIKGGAVSIN